LRLESACELFAVNSILQSLNPRNRRGEAEINQRLQMGCGWQNREQGFALP
jgi:hypothetical protein